MNFNEAAADVQSIIDSMEAVKGKQFADVAKTFAGATPILIGIEMVEHGIAPAELVQQSLTLFIAAAMSQLCTAYGLDAKEIAEASKLIATKMKQHAKDIES